MKHREGAFRTGATALTRPLFAALWLLFFSQVASGQSSGGSGGNSSCEAGVWDIADAEDDRSGLVPFAPRLVASGPDASSLAYSDDLGAAFRFKVRVSDWFAAEDVALEVSDCDSPDLSKPDTSVADATEGTGCPYKIYSADFPFSATGGTATGGQSCTFAVTELPDLTQVHGYVVVKANLTQTWLGADFLRTFQMPLGFYIDLETDFSVDVNVTVENANECYLDSDCNNYECVLAPEGANLCDCDVSYDINSFAPGFNASALQSLCLSYNSISKALSGSTCLTDVSDPVCEVSEAAFMIDVDAVDEGPATATLSANQNLSIVFDVESILWDDCQAPNDGPDYDQNDVVLVTRTISVVGNGLIDSGYQDVQTWSQQNKYHADDLQTFVFPLPNNGLQSVEYEIVYEIEDLAGLTQTCDTVTATVKDTSPPVCPHASETLPARGTLASSWQSYLQSWVEGSIPINFPAGTATSLLDSLQDQAGMASSLTSNQDYATVIADLALSRCWDFNTDQPFMTDAQGRARCSKIKFQSTAGGGTEVTVDLPSPVDTFDVVYGPAGEIVDPNDILTITTAIYDWALDTVVPAIQSSYPCSDADFYLSDVGGANEDGCLPEGNYQVTIEIVDAAGNSADCAAHTLSIDNTPPDAGCEDPSPAIGGLYDWVRPLRYGVDPTYISNPLPTTTIAADSLHLKYLAEIESTSIDGTTAPLAPTHEDAFTCLQPAPAGDSGFEYHQIQHRDDTVLLTEVSAQYTEIGTFINFTLPTLTLFHPQQYQSVLTETEQEELVVRMYAVYALMDAVGNLKILTVEYIAHDVTPPELTCATSEQSYDLPAENGPTTYSLTESDVLATFSFTDNAKKVPDAWFDNPQSVTIEVYQNPVTGVCFLQWTSLTSEASADNLDANQGRTLTTRRRALSGYVVSCNDPFTQLTTNSHQLSLSSPTDVTSLDPYFQFVGGAQYNASVVQLSLSEGIIVPSILSLLDDVIVEANQSVPTEQGYYHKLIPAPGEAPISCTPVPYIVNDVTDPFIDDACAAYDDQGTAHVYTVSPADSCVDIGIVEDELNYVSMVSVLKDNAQFINQGGEYEYVHLEPSYLDPISDLTSSTCFDRDMAPQIITYTAYDASGNFQSCDKEIIVTDPNAPKPDDANCEVNAGSTVYVPMDLGGTSAVYLWQFTVIEGQSNFNNWIVTLSGDTDDLQDSCTEDVTIDCADNGDGTHLCSASLLLTHAESTYSCTYTFQEDTYVPYGVIEAPTESCTVYLMLVDTEAPVLECPPTPVEIPYTATGLPAELATLLGSFIVYSDNVDISTGETITISTPTTPWLLDQNQAFTWLLRNTNTPPDNGLISTTKGQGLLELQLQVFDTATILPTGPPEADGTYHQGANTDYIGNSDNCTFEVTPVGFCGDGFMDLYGLWGPADECEINGHPESPGCIDAITHCECGPGYVPDPTGGCLVDCAAGTCDVASQVLPDTTTDPVYSAAGDCSATVTGTGGTSLPYDVYIDSLEPDCTPAANTDLWSDICTTFYTDPNAGYTHHPYEEEAVAPYYYEWDDQENVFMSYTETQMTDLLATGPHEDIAFEWYDHSDSEPLTLKDASGLNGDIAPAELKVCACAFSVDTFVEAFVLDPSGNMVTAESYCISVGRDDLEPVHDDETGCWTFPLCRTGPVILGAPKYKTGNYLTCDNTNQANFTNEVSGTNLVNVDLDILSRVYPFPDITLDTTNVDFSPSINILNSTENMTDVTVRMLPGDTLPLTITVTVSIADETNLADNSSLAIVDSCEFKVKIEDKVKPTIDCAQFAISGDDFACDSVDDSDPSAIVHQCRITSDVPKVGFSVDSNADADDETALDTGDCEFPTYTFTGDLSPFSSLTDESLYLGSVATNAYSGCTQSPQGYVPSAGELNYGSNVFTFYLIDRSGNEAESCTVEYVVADDFPPTLSCPHGDPTAAYGHPAAPKVIPYNDSLPYYSGSSTIDFTKFDNIGFLTSESVLDEPAGYADSETFDFYQADRQNLYAKIINRTDYDGNEVSCTVYFKFEDQEAPELTCPDSLINSIDENYGDGISPALYINDFGGLGLALGRIHGLFSVSDNSYDATDPAEVPITLEWAWQAPTEWQAQDLSPAFDSTGPEPEYDALNYPLETDRYKAISWYDVNYGNLATVWVPDLMVTVVATDTQSRQDGEVNTQTCTFTVTFDDTRAPELKWCGEDELSVTALTASDYFSDFNLTLVPAGSGQNDVTLLDPETHCEPGQDGDIFTDDPFAQTEWCPRYEDDYGGGDYRGNAVSVDIETFVLGTTTSVIFTADDGRPNSADGTITCDITIIDDIPPEWRECTSPLESRDFLTSFALQTPGSPRTSVWDWNTLLTVDHIVSIFNNSTLYSSVGETYPYPVDNSDQMVDLGNTLADFKSSTFFDDVVVGDQNSVYTESSLSTVLRVGDSNPAHDVSCSVEYNIVDDVKPIAVCSGTNGIPPDDTTLLLSDCDSDDVGVDNTNHKETCRFTMTYKVEEDIALNQPCKKWDQKTGGGTCVEGGDDEYGPGISLQLFSDQTDDLKPGFIDVGGLPVIANSQLPVDIDNFEIIDWDGNFIDLNVEDCPQTVTIVDDVDPSPLHGVSGNGNSCVSPGASTTTYIRLLEDQLQVVIPEALLPRPVAEDADWDNFKVTVNVSGDATAQEIIGAWDKVTQLFPDVDETAIRTRSNGTYTFTYIYEDGSGNTAQCEWQVTVLEQFEDPSIEALTVEFTVTEDSGSTRRRLSSLPATDARNSLLSVSGSAQHAQSPALARLVERVQVALAAEEQAGKEGAKRRNLAQSPPVNANADATLVYYVSTTYPWLVETIPGNINIASSNATDGLTNAQSISISYVASIGCDPASRTRAAPEDVGSDGASGDGVCFTAWKLDVQNVNCESVEEQITLTHTAQCAPVPANIFHYNSNGALSPTCLDGDKSRAVTITIKAQQFCKLQMATVALQERTQVGNRAWMNSILNAGEVQGEDYGNYYAVDSIDNQPEFLFDGAEADELVEICMLLWVTSEQTSANDGASVLEDGGIQFQSLAIDSFGVTSDGSSNWTAPDYSVFTNDQDLRTNMVGICFNVTAPDLAIDEVTEEDTLTISVTGTATYDIAGQGTRRRRVALALETASLTASERVTVTLRDTEEPGKEDPLAPAGSGKSGGPSDGAAQVEPSLMRAVLASLLVLCALTTLCQKKNYWRQVLANTPYAKDGSRQPVPQVDGWRGPGGDDGVSGRNLVLHDQGLRADQPFPETSPLTASVEESEMVSLSSSADF